MAFVTVVLRFIANAHGIDEHQFGYTKSHVLGSVAAIAGIVITVPSMSAASC